MKVKTLDADLKTRPVITRSGKHFTIYIKKHTGWMTSVLMCMNINEYRLPELHNSEDEVQSQRHLYDWLLGRPITPLVQWNNPRLPPNNIGVGSNTAESSFNKWTGVCDV